MRTLSYRDAINEALIQEMERDDSVFVYGIDVGDHKRIFGTTNGLVERFGKERCFSTPLSEDAMTGLGLGAAIKGCRPVHVHMRADFLLLAMNQLVNMVSSYCYGSGGDVSVPLVIRVIIGRGWGQSYQHSKNLNILAHFPGLKIILPTSPYEAKGMLISAIRDDNPVLCMEHRWLYDIVGDVPENEYMVSLDQPRMLRQGKDITIVAVSWMNIEAMKAAEILEKQGVEVEIINACSACYFDDKIMVDSIKKTKNCIIVDNDWTYCGFSAELVASLTEQCMRFIKEPMSRIGFAHVPCPCARTLEDQFYPNAIDIIREVERKLRLGKSDLCHEDFYTYENKFKGPF